MDEKTRFRVQIKHAVAIGPGKADVLEGIAETGSIAEAGRRLGMSCQRVRTLVAAMNTDFIEPLGCHRPRVTCAPLLDSANPMDSREVPCIPLS